MIRIALPLCALACAAFANVSLSIPLGPDAEMRPARYVCEGGDPFPVQYVSAAPNNLALLPIDGKQHIFVNVISGSGARYVSGQYEWWTKGDEATLHNAMKESDSQACTTVETGSAP